MSKSISMGNKKAVHKSIRIAAEKAGVKYITYYQRLRMGMSPAKAASLPVRKYVKTEV
jgi:hypothetical protein